MPLLDLAELFFGVHRGSLSQFLGLCEKEQKKQASRLIQLSQSFR